MYGHPISENAIEKTGIEHYYYIAKFNYGDAINTTCNLLARQALRRYIYYQR